MEHRVSPGSYPCENTTAAQKGRCKKITVGGAVAWTACLLEVGTGPLYTAPAGHSSVKQGTLDHSVDKQKKKKGTQQTNK